MDRVDISIDISEAVGQAVAQGLEERGLAVIPVDTGIAAVAVAEAEPGSDQEQAAAAELRRLVERDVDRARQRLAASEG